MDQATKILDLCKKVGIKTAFELQEYRHEHNCRSNEDTIRALTETLGRIEKREKAIDGMYNDISRQCELHPTTAKCAIGDCERCEKGLLYDAGYRKEEEVRREERKMILNRIRNMYKETGNCINYETLVFIRGLAKEFGVEVEE